MTSDNLVTAHAHNVIILYGATVNMNPVSAAAHMLFKSEIQATFTLHQYSLEPNQKCY